MEPLALVLDAGYWMYGNFKLVNLTMNVHLADSLGDLPEFLRCKQGLSKHVYFAGCYLDTASNKST